MNKKCIKLWIAWLVWLCAYKVISKNRRTIKKTLFKYIDNEKLVDSYIQTKINTSKNLFGRITEIISKKNK